MLLLATAIGLLQFSSLLPSGNYPPTFLDWRGRPVQPAQGLAMMNAACPFAEDSLRTIVARESRLSAWFEQAGGDLAVDSLAVLACLRIRIGDQLAPPDRPRFLMKPGAPWHEGAIRAALAALRRAPDSLPVLRAAAYAAISLAAEYVGTPPTAEGKALFDATAGHLITAGKRGVRDPVVLTSCVHLQAFLHQPARAFRCALLGAVDPTDRTWYLTRMAWLLARDGRTDEARALVAVAIGGARRQVDRAEIAFMLPGPPGSGTGLATPDWVEQRIERFPATSTSDLGLALRRLAPLGWGWQPRPDRTPTEPACDGQARGAGSTPEIGLASLWQPDSLVPSIVGWNLGLAGNQRSLTGWFQYQSLVPPAPDAPDAGVRVALSGAGDSVPFVWSINAAAYPAGVGVYALAAVSADGDSLDAYGVHEHPTTSAGPQLSDVVLTPAGYRLGFSPSGWTVEAVPTDEGTGSRIRNLFFQILSPSDAEDAVLEIAIIGCEEGEPIDLMRVSSPIRVEVGLTEVWRELVQPTPGPGWHRVAITLRSGSGVVWSSRSRVGGSR